jgi:RimJ/RimL family protein N-acetyltransferase
LEKKLIIRKPLVDDAEKIINYLNQVGGESDNLLFGKNEFHLNVEQEREYLKNVNNDGNSLFLVGLMDDEIISIAQLSSSNRKRIAHNFDLGISVKQAFCHKGIGSAMVEELVNFAKTNHKNINLSVKASNVNAINLYEKFGFKKVGCHKNYLCINGEYDDQILMDLDLVNM